jgi:hypothetical protein
MNSPTGNVFKTGYLVPEIRQADGHDQRELDEGYQGRWVRFVENRLDWFSRAPGRALIVGTILAESSLAGSEQSAMPGEF